MLAQRVIPCLLLRRGALVKTRQFQVPRYVGDPLNAVHIFNSKEVDELILLDISATSSGEGPSFDEVAEVASECYMPLTYGGGVTDLDHFRKLFSLGVEKVCVNSALSTGWQLVEQAASLFGRQSIVASIDVRLVRDRYVVFTHNGKQSLQIDPITFSLLAEQHGAGEIMLTSIDRDGTRTGYDLKLVRSVTEKVNVPVLASGGAGTLDHVHDVLHLAHASGACLGSMAVYQGRHDAVLINFPHAQAIRDLVSNPGKA